MIENNDHGNQIILFLNDERNVNHLKPRNENHL
jgi:hypothetical protein